jgi:hypothetical protein
VLWWELRDNVVFLWMLGAPPALFHLPLALLWLAQWLHSPVGQDKGAG